MDRIACIDDRVLDRLRRQGGAELIRELVTVFLEDAPKRLESGREGARARDLDRTRRAAHSLKASAATLGAGALCSVSARIERLAGDCDTGAVDALLGQWESSLRDARQGLERVVLDDRRVAG